MHCGTHSAAVNQNALIWQMQTAGTSCACERTMARRPSSVLAPVQSALRWTHGVLLRKCA